MGGRLLSDPPPMGGRLLSDPPPMGGRLLSDPPDSDGLPVAGIKSIDPGNISLITGLIRVTQA
jgi:hypothetical protein